LLKLVYYYYYSRFAAHFPGLPVWAGTRSNIHPLTYPDHHPTFISFFRVLQSIASSLLNVRAWQSFCTTCLQVLFGLPLGLDSLALHLIINTYLYSVNVFFLQHMPIALQHVLLQYQDYIIYS